MAKFERGNNKGKKFKPGKSGNPSGRPRRTRLTDALFDQLATGDDETTAEKVAAALIREALAGNIAAIKELFDRTEGRPRQQLDIDMVSGDWQELAKAAGLTRNEIRDAARELLTELGNSTGD